jgi:hypothetical protein
MVDNFRRPEASRAKGIVGSKNKDEKQDVTYARHTRHHSGRDRAKGDNALRDNLAEDERCLLRMRVRHVKNKVTIVTGD